MYRLLLEMENDRLSAEDTIVSERGMRACCDITSHTPKHTSLSWLAFDSVYALHSEECRGDDVKSSGELIFVRLLFF